MCIPRNNQRFLMCARKNVDSSSEYYSNLGHKTESKRIRKNLKLRGLLYRAAVSSIFIRYFLQARQNSIGSLESRKIKQQNKKIQRQKNVFAFSVESCSIFSLIL